VHTAVHHALDTMNSGSGILISFLEVRPPMLRMGAMEAAADVLRIIFPAVLLLCLAVSGCGSTCYSGFWNGNASGVAVSNSSSCPLARATGAVSVQMRAAPAPPAASAAFPSSLASPPAPSSASPVASPTALPSHVQHIFVTLLGIEAHPNMMADEDSSGWQELAPDLAAHPMQLDLLAPSAPLAMTGDSRSLASPASANVPATVPADEYRQLRLRLLPRDPSPNVLIPESNACGNLGWNCLVLADRSVHPLVFAPSEFAAAAEFQITPEPGADRVFRVLPGEVIQLSIEFDPASSVFFASNAAVRLVPVFRVVSRTSSPAATAQ
jgi:hypothetical protein